LVRKLAWLAGLPAGGTLKVEVLDVTKAERFRYVAERSAHKPAQPTKAKRREPTENKLRSAGVTEGLEGAGRSAMHNYSPRGARRSVYAFEGSVEGARPSRKSTRGSSHHIKTDSAVRRRIMKQVEGPSTRHDRRSP
jgi:hypothetical protein